nr:hypothetical protein CFP56_03919 [Quercus suber]
MRERRKEMGNNTAHPRVINHDQLPPRPPAPAAITCERLSSARGASRPRRRIDALAMTCFCKTVRVQTKGGPSERLDRGWTMTRRRGLGERGRGGKGKEVWRAMSAMTTPMNERYREVHEPCPGATVLFTELVTPFLPPSLPQNRGEGVWDDRCMAEKTSTTSTRCDGEARPADPIVGGDVDRAGTGEGEKQVYHVLDLVPKSCHHHLLHVAGLSNGSQHMHTRPGFARSHSFASVRARRVPGKPLSPCRASSPHQQQPNVSITWKRVEEDCDAGGPRDDPVAVEVEDLSGRWKIWGGDEIGRHLPVTRPPTDSGRSYRRWTRLRPEMRKMQGTVETREQGRNTGDGRRATGDGVRVGSSSGRGRTFVFDARPPARVPGHSRDPVVLYVYTRQYLQYLQYCKVLSILDLGPAAEPELGSFTHWAGRPCGRWGLGNLI